MHPATAPRTETVKWRSDRTSKLLRAVTQSSHADDGRNGEGDAKSASPSPSPGVRGYGGAGASITPLGHRPPDPGRPAFRARTRPAVPPRCGHSRPRPFPRGLSRYTTGIPGFVRPEFRDTHHTAGTSPAEARRAESYSPRLPVMRNPHNGETRQTARRREKKTQTTRSTRWGGKPPQIAAQHA